MHIISSTPPPTPSIFSYNVTLYIYHYTFHPIRQIQSNTICNDPNVVSFSNFPFNLHFEGVFYRHFLTLIL